MNWQDREKIERYAPRRPIDWCWRAARRIVDELRRSPGKRGNPRISETVRFLRARERCKSDRGREAVQLRWFGISGALRLYDEAGHRLWEIQARILAGQSDEAIGTLCGVPAEVIDWYEALFFQVRENLHAHDWVHLRAIGTRVGSVAKYPDLATLWRGMAYTGGELVLDLFIAVTLGRPLPDWVREPPRDDQERYEERLRLEFEVLVELQMLPADTDPLLVIALDSDLRRQRALSLGERSAPLSTLADRVKLLLGDIHLPAETWVDDTGEARVTA
jgi:hypothetical protein